MNQEQKIKSMIHWGHYILLNLVYDDVTDVLKCIKTSIVSIKSLRVFSILICRQQHDA